MSQITDPIPALPKTANKRIPLEPILKYKEMGLTHAEVAKLLGCSRPNITQRLKGIKALTALVENFSENETKYYQMSMVQDFMLKFGLTSEELKKGVGQRLMTSIGIAKDKEELASGRRPAGVNVNVLAISIEDKESRLKELRDRLKYLRSQPITTKYENSTESMENGP